MVSWYSWEVYPFLNRNGVGSGWRKEWRCGEETRRRGGRGNSGQDVKQINLKNKNVFASEEDVTAPMSGSSQLLTTAVSGHTVPSSGFHRHQHSCVLISPHRHIHICTLKNKINLDL